MAYVVDHSESKSRPTVNDFTITWDDCYLDIDRDRVSSLPFARKRMIAQQTRLPGYEKMDHPQLTRELSEYLNNIVSWSPSHEGAFKRAPRLPNPIPVYVNRYDEFGARRSIRMINGFGEGLSILTDRRGNIIGITEYHDDLENGLTLDFDQKGNLKKRIRGSESGGLLTVETWEDRKYTIYYYLNGKQISKEGYRNYLRSISQEVEGSTLLPRDVVKGVLEKYY